MATEPHDPAIERDDEPTNITPIGATPSYVELLRQDYKELSEAEDVLIPVQGYERVGLRVKYRMPESGKELDAISRKVMREFKDTFSRNLYTALDTMIVLCEGLYIQPLASELELETQVTEPIPLDPELSGEAVRFDQRLAEALGLGSDIPGARQVTRRLFGNNDMAVISHAEKLSRWLANTKADLDVEFWQLGEGI